MIRVAMDIPLVEVWYDLRSKSWEIQYKEETFMLRDWNWGERYGLVYRSVTDGRFDRQKFVDFVLSELLDRVPDKEPIILANAVLELLDVPRRQPDFSLAHGEFLLAKAFGWRPSQLCEEPVASLDTMVQTLFREEQRRNAASKHYEDESWTSIVFQAPSIDTSSENASGPNLEDIDQELLSRLRFREKLDAVAVWAGDTVDWTERDDGRLFGCEVVSGAMPCAAEATGKTAGNNKDGTSKNGGESFSKSSAFENAQDEITDETSTFFYRGIARLKGDSRRSDRKTENLGDTKHEQSHASARLTRVPQVKSYSEPAGDRAPIKEKATSNAPIPSVSSRESTFRPSQDKAKSSGPIKRRPQSNGPVEQHSANLSAGGNRETGNPSRLTTARLASPTKAKPDTGKATSPRPGIARIQTANGPSTRSPEVSGKQPEAPRAQRPLYSVVQGSPAKKRAGFANFPARAAGVYGTGFPENNSLSRAPHNNGGNPAGTIRESEAPWRSAEMGATSEKKEISPHGITLEPAWTDNAFEYPASHSDVETSHPFALSELEERMADVLERAAREAGVDLP